MLKFGIMLCVASLALALDGPVYLGVWVDPVQKSVCSKPCGEDATALFDFQRCDKAMPSDVCDPAEQKDQTLPCPMIGCPPGGLVEVLKDSTLSCESTNDIYRRFLKGDELMEPIQQPYDVVLELGKSYSHEIVQKWIDTAQCNKLGIENYINAITSAKESFVQQAIDEVDKVFEVIQKVIVCQKVIQEHPYEIFAKLCTKRDHIENVEKELNQRIQHLEHLIYDCDQQVKGADLMKGMLDNLAVF